MFRWGKGSNTEPSGLKADTAVLVVSEEPDTREALFNQLTELGVGQPWQAATGDEALALLENKRQHVDLIICDLDVPRMTSMDFLYRTGERQLRVQVLLASGKGARVLGSAERLCEFYGIDVIGALDKPLTMSDLDAALKQALGPRYDALDSRGDPEEKVYLDGAQQFQLEAFYQPIVAVESGEVLAAEALARLQHPELGEIAPGEFVAAMERSGEIEQLTLNMLALAAAACARWQQRGVACPVAVNLSTSTLVDNDFPAVASRIARQYGLDASNIVFDLTSSIELTNDWMETRNLRRLRMHGFGLSISDFDTGALSRDQLLNIPFTELRINRDLVGKMLVHNDALQQVERLVSVARELDVPCVATGVETEAILDYLQVINCNAAQGYYCSRPLSETEFVVFAKDANSASIRLRPPR